MHDSLLPISTLFPREEPRCTKAGILHLAAPVYRGLKQLWDGRTRYLVQNPVKHKKALYRPQGPMGAGGLGSCIRRCLSSIGTALARAGDRSPPLLPAPTLLPGPSLSVAWPLGLHRRS